MQSNIATVENPQPINHLPAIQEDIDRLDNSLSDTPGGHVNAIKREIDALLNHKDGPKTQAPYDLNSSLMILNALTDKAADIERYYDISLYVLLCLLQDEAIDKIGTKLKFQAIPDNKLLYLMVFVLAYIHDETEEGLLDKLKNIGIPANKVQALLSQARAKSDAIKKIGIENQKSFAG